MAFSGLASNELNTASLIQRSIAEIARGLSIKETPILAWLGDAEASVTSIKHEFIEDNMLPNTIIASTVINSAAVATPIGIQVAPAGIGLALNVGQLLRNESAAPEVYQVTSIVGAGNSIVVSRDYNGTTVAGSLAPGGTLYVGGAAAVEGAEHSGADTRRVGTVRANTVGLFRMELAQSNTQFGLAQVGNDKWEDRQRKGTADILRQLENEVVKGVLNGTNSLGSTTVTRTMQGIQAQLTSINSTVASNSFVANPHLYIGNVWESMYGNGASPSETWGIVAGSTWFRALSDLNDTKVQDSNEREEFKRVIRTYTGPFGQAELFLSRVLPATELLIVPRERLAVKALTGRSFDYKEMGVSGDNRKGLLTGEYTLELYHQAAMGRAHA
jgi:hypothetical protein